MTIDDDDPSRPATLVHRRGEFLQESQQGVRARRSRTDYRQIGRQWRHVTVLW